MTIWVDKDNCSNCKYATDEHSFCSIRNQPVENNIWIYCMNHPRFNKDEVTTAIGPMYNYVPNHYDRTILNNSPDTPLVRNNLLEQAKKIKEVPDYHIIDIMRDEVIVFQLGEFKDERALPLLNKIKAFDVDIKCTPPIEATIWSRKLLIEEVILAIEKINNDMMTHGVV